MKTGTQEQLLKRGKEAKNSVRKPRADPKQRRPLFEAFTESWGLRSNNKVPDKEWKLWKSATGFFAHPFLASSVQNLWTDFATGMFPYRFKPHALRHHSHSFEGIEPDVSKGILLEQVGFRLRARQRGYTLSEVELQLLDVCMTHARIKRRQHVRFAHAMLAAAACGDAAFFEHLALIMKSYINRKRAPKRKGMPFSQAMEQAFFAAQRKASPDPSIAHPEVDWADVDEAMHEYFTDWGKRDVITRKREIERECKALGLALKGKRAKTKAKP